MTPALPPAEQVLCNNPVIVTGLVESAKALPGLPNSLWPVELRVKIDKILKNDLNPIHPVEAVIEKGQTVGILGGVYMPAKGSTRREYQQLADRFGTIMKDWGDIRTPTDEQVNEVFLGKKFIFAMARGQVDGSASAKIWRIDLQDWAAAACA